jgi:hypothetical protein
MKIKYIGKYGDKGLETAYVVEMPPQKRILTAVTDSGVQHYYVSLPKLYFIVQLYKNSFSRVNVLTSNAKKITLSTNLKALSFPNIVSQYGGICLGQGVRASKDHEKVIERAINAFYKNKFGSPRHLPDWAKNTKKNPRYVVKPFSTLSVNLKALLPKFDWEEFTQKQPQEETQFQHHK